MWVSSARLMVKAHGAKRFVIAVKNTDEAEYRYLVATDLTWRTLDIVQCYTLRWLVETFFEDRETPRRMGKFGQAARRKGVIPWLNPKFCCWTMLCSPILSNPPA